MYISLPNNEEAMRNLEMQFVNIIDKSIDGFMLNDMDGKLLYVNDALCNILGYDREELLKMYIRDIEYAESPEDTHKHLATIIKEGSDRFETIHKRKDSSLIDIEISTSFNPETESFYSFVRDLTEKKQKDSIIKAREKELKIRKEIAESFIKSEKYGFFNSVLNVLKKDYNCDFGLFGFVDNEENFVVPSMTTEIWDICEMENKTASFPKEQWGGVWGKSLLEKKTIIKNSGMEVPAGHIKIKNAISAVVKKGEELVGLIVLANRNDDFTTEDINKLNDTCEYISPLLVASLNELHFKQELIDAKERAEESDELKTAFLANMSHEVRTPLNGILGFLDMFLDPDLDTEERKEYLEIIRSSSDRIVNTFNDIIEISMLESGQVKINLSDFNIIESAESIFKYFNIQAKKQGLRLSLINNTDCKKIVINTDKSKVESILSNYVKNALKFTKKGSIDINISVNDNNIIFAVKDTGIGVDVDKQDIIFDRFVQADSYVTRPYEGIGLGLSISKSYADLLNGKVWVESESGNGSTFYLSIPYDDSAIFEKSITSIKNEREYDSDIKILIVEDDLVSQMFIERVLSSNNIPFEQAYNGIEAIQKLKEDDKIGLILMDLKMPKMDGYAATTEIRKFNKKIPIIAQTAFAMPEDKRKAFKAGCTDFLAKPINKKELINKIHSILAR